MLDRSLIAVTDVLATTPGVMFCIKSIDGTYLYVNLPFAERVGIRDTGLIVGKSARDIFPKELAESYEEQDAEILATGKMLTNEIEVIAAPDGQVGWFLTSKSRWTNDAGVPAGIVSVSIDLRSPANLTDQHSALSRAVEVARARFSENISVSHLAEAADMSTTQLERLARRVLGITPKQVIMRFRLERALMLLETTNKTLSEIATECGYYDQSDFTNHFRRAVGWSPTSWRSLS